MNIKLRDLALFFVFWVLASIAMYDRELENYESRQERLEHSIPYKAKVTAYSYVKNTGSKVRTYYLDYVFRDYLGNRRQGTTTVPKDLYYKYRTGRYFAPLPILQDRRYPSRHAYHDNWTKVAPYDDVELYGIAIMGGLLMASIVFFVSLIATPYVRKTFIWMRSNVQK